MRSPSPPGERPAAPSAHPDLRQTARNRSRRPPGATCVYGTHRKGVTPRNRPTISRGPRQCNRNLRLSARLPWQAGLRRTDARASSGNRHPSALSFHIGCVVASIALDSATPKASERPGRGLPEDDRLHDPPSRLPSGRTYRTAAPFKGIGHPPDDGTGTGLPLAAAGRRASGSPGGVRRALHAVEPRWFHCQDGPKPVYVVRGIPGVGPPSPVGRRRIPDPR